MCSAIPVSYTHLRVQHLILQGGVQGAAGVYLLIVLNLRTLCAGGDAPIHPFGLFPLFAKTGDVYKRQLFSSRRSLRCWKAAT